MGNFDNIRIMEDLFEGLEADFKDLDPRNSSQGFRARKTVHAKGWV